MSKAEEVSLSESGERSVRFRCAASDAQAVFLASTFNNWDPAATPMQRDDGDEWLVAVALSPGTYEYKFIVDGEWRCEPGVADDDYTGEDAVANPFGTKNRVIEVN